MHLIAVVMQLPYRISLCCFSLNQIGVSPLLFYEDQTIDIVSTHVKESNGQMLQESKMKQVWYMIETHIAAQCKD